MKITKSKVIVTIVILILAVIAAFGVIIAHMLTGDPKAQADNKAQDQLYTKVAYEASSIRGTVSTGQDVEALKQNIVSTSNVYLANPTVTGPTTITWEAAAKGAGDATVFLSHETSQLYACFLVRASTLKKIVEVEPMRCKAFQALASNNPLEGKEITLRKEKINALREAHNDNHKCYPNKLSDGAARNPYWYECKH